MMQLNNTETAVRADINVTPLIDVVLVLLIIFMVVTPLMVNRNIQLPNSKSKGVPVKDSVKIIYLNLDGTIFFEEKPVVADVLTHRLMELQAKGSATQIMLHADKRLQYAEVMSLLEIISQAGFANIGLIAMPAKS